MNILHIAASMNPSTGGIAQGIRSSIPALKQLGLQNEVVCLDAPSVALAWGDDFPLHALGASRGPWCYHPNLLPWLHANLARFSAIIVNGLWLYPSHATRKALEQSRSLRPSETNPRLFVMPHGMLDPWFQRAEGRRLKAIRNRLYWQLIEKQVINESDGLLFTCEQEMLLARETFPDYHPRTQHNVGYGIAAPPVYTAEMMQAFHKYCPLVTGRSYLLFLSRLHEKKGADMILKAYLQLKHEGMELPALVLAGPGLNSEYGQSLVEQAAGEEDIFFPGMLEGHAKWGAFYGCEAFVLLSHQENFGIAVVEALACGKPVLISNQVNICREVVGGGAGLVEVDTIYGAIRLISGFQQLDKSRREQMKQNAFRVFNTNFTVEAFSEILVDTLAREIATK